MLDLDAGVHLDEIEVAGRLVVEIFERAGAAIADRFASAHGGGAELPRARSRREASDGASSQTFWRRRCSEHSRSKQWIARVAVAEHLHLDMAGAWR